MKRKLLLLISLLSLAAFAFAQEKIVSGTVTDADGAPLPGAAVLIKGTTQGTVSDIDGNFRLSVDGENTVLQIKIVGFKTQEITVGAQSIINISLEEDTKQLDEIVVTGYGATVKKMLTKSVAKVNADEIVNFSTPSFEGILQGRTSGVQVTSTSGVLGAPVTVRVRGASSINASSQPLYVIDGVPVSTGDTGTDSGTIGSGNGGPGTNPLINLSPNDIASVEVLKDASAAAIYGSRGSNGVVLITTKRGNVGKPKINLNYYAGYQEATDLYNMLDGPQFASMWNYAGASLYRDVLGITIDEAKAIWADPNDPTHGAILGGYAGLDEANSITTDWVDQMTQRGFMQEVSGSITGGTEATKYFASGTYSDTDGYITNNNLKKYNFRLNLDQRISEKFSATFSAAPSFSENTRVAQENAVAAGLTYAALYFPNVEAYDDDGTPNLTVSPNVFGQFNGSPLSNQLGNEYLSDIIHVITDASLKYNPLPGLIFQTKFGAEILMLEERERQGSETTDGWIIGTGFALNERFTNYVWTNTATYDRDWGDHGLNALLGMEFQNSTRDQITVSGNTFADNRLKTLNSAAEIVGGTGFESEFAFVGYFTSIGYDYKDKLLLNFTARYDGSSRFGDNNQYGFFPSGSAGYILSEEFDIPVLPFLKLRAGYGVTGNAAIGNFDSRGLVSFGRDYNANPGYEPSGIANPDLTWEETGQFDAALEFGLLEGERIRGSVGYYNKVTDGLLLDVPLPVEFGLSPTNTSTNPVITQNVGKLKNSGWEFEVAADIFKGEFNWTLSFNLATLDNEVLELPDNDGDGKGDDIINGRNIIREGEPLSAFYTVEYAGVDSENGNALYYAELPSDADADLVALHSAATEAGTIVDRNGRMVTSDYNTAANFRKVLGNPWSNYYGGITNSLSWKGIDFNIFFQFDQGRDLYMSEARFYGANMNSVFNQTTDQLDYWTADNPNASIPEPRLFTQNGRQHSSRFLQDGTYVRLKVISLGYTFPKKWMKDTKLRLFIQGQNIWTSANNFTGLDPEVNNNNRTTTPGNIFFSPPQPKKFTGGLNLNF